MPQYFLFNKPYQVLTQFSKEGDKKTLADFLSQLPKDVYPAGRLDYDSEGLLFLTNDKTLIHQLLEPRYAHQRTYWVQVDGMITEDALKKLQQGVSISIDGKQHLTKPAIAKALPADTFIADRNPPIRYRKDIPTSWISLTLTEGKNRQVRRMTAAVGFPTLRLMRYSIGQVTLNGLQSGDFIEMDESIKSRLLQKN